MSFADLNVENYNKAELCNIFSLDTTMSDYEKKDHLISVSHLVSKDNTKSVKDKNDFYNFILKSLPKLDLSSIASDLEEELYSLNSNEDNSLVSLHTKKFSNPHSMIAHGEHYLIEDERAKKAYTDKHEKGRKADDPTNNPPGIINPFNIHTFSKGVNIDTRFRPNYYNTSSTDFSFTLPHPIHNCCSMQLGSMSLPISMYNVSKKLGNNAFKIVTVATEGAQPSTKIIRIPDGNYQSPISTSSPYLSIETAINSALSNNGIDPQNTLCFRVDPVTGKSVFAVPNNGTSNLYSFEIYFAIDDDGNTDEATNIQLKFGWQLGFRLGAYIGGPAGVLPAPATQGAAILSEGACIMSLPRYIYLIIEDYSNTSTGGHFQSGFQSSLLPAGVFTVISLGSSGNVYPYTMIEASGQTTSINTTRTYFGPVTIEKLHFRLVDEYNRLIDLNNMDWSISLGFNCLY